MCPSAGTLAIRYALGAIRIDVGCFINGTPPTCPGSSYSCGYRLSNEAPICRIRRGSLAEGLATRRTDVSDPRRIRHRSQDARLCQTRRPAGHHKTDVHPLRLVEWAGLALWRSERPADGDRPRIVIRGRLRAAGAMFLGIYMTIPIKHLEVAGLASARRERIAGGGRRRAGTAVYVLCT